MVAAARRLARRRPASGTVVMAVVWTLTAAVTGVGLSRPADSVAPESLSEDPAPASLGSTLSWKTAAKFSDAVQVPDTTTVLLVDDDVDDHLFAWDAASGVGVSPIPLALPPGVRVNDAEAITSDGGHIYVAGSHSLSEQGVRRHNRLLRLRWAEGRVALDAAVDNLAELLSAALPAVAAVTGRRPDDGGLNIEGLAWDAARSRLLVALRSPIGPGGDALVVPLRWPAEATAPEVESPLRVGGLQGAGARALQFDRARGKFLLTTGRDGAAGADGGFTLWQWSGVDGADATPITRFPVRLEGVPVKPEGVALVTLPGQSPFVLAVADDAPFLWMIRD